MSTTNNTASNTQSSIFDRTQEEIEQIHNHIEEVVTHLYLSAIDKIQIRKSLRIQNISIFNQFDLKTVEYIIISSVHGLCMKANRPKRSLKNILQNWKREKRMFSDYNTIKLS